MQYVKNSGLKDFGLNYRCIRRIGAYA